MPELPEVETIRRALLWGGRDGPSIVGRRILGAHLLWERTLATPLPEEFLERLPGQVIEDIGRRGKFLLLRLTADTLLFHLRMSGDLVVEPIETPPAPHHRLMLDLEGGLRLSFNDTRKFGRAWLVADPQEVLGGLGPEPLEDELSQQDFYERLHAHRRQLKPLLLDQSFLAGLGNIYADEALHLSRLHPLAIASALDQPAAARLLASIRQVLEEGILRQGASIDWVYRGGDFQNYFRVYQRGGQPCPECGAPVVRIVVGQRSTHYCPDCQQMDFSGE
jgi:formamidopyrimidine-DNA glycosylase